MIIKPIKLKNGKVATNLDICKIMYNTLKGLETKKPSQSERNFQKQLVKLHKICGGSENTTQIMNWLEQIVKCDDEEKAQNLINDTLLPVIDIDIEK